MTEIELAHLMRQSPVSVSVTTSRSILGHRPSWGHHTSTMHGIGVCLGNITAIAMLDEVVVQLMGCMLCIGDRGPGIRISARIVA